MANKYMKKYSTFLAIRANQNYIEILAHPDRMAIIKKTNNK
jgi:hypothetical protein